MVGKVLLRESAKLSRELANFLCAQRPARAARMRRTASGLRRRYMIGGTKAKEGRRRIACEKSAATPGRPRTRFDSAHQYARSLRLLRLRLSRAEALGSA